MAETTEGYDKVAQAVARGATAFWKTVFDDLGKGGTGRLASLSGKDAAGITPDDIKNFFNVLGGASMNIDFIPQITKGTKTYFDSGSVKQGTGLVVNDENGITALGVEGSISIGIGIKF